MMTFPSEIMGEGKSLTSSSSANLWTRPEMVRWTQNPFQLSKNDLLHYFREETCLQRHVNPIKITWKQHYICNAALKSLIGHFSSYRICLHVYNVTTNVLHNIKSCFKSCDNWISRPLFFFFFPNSNPNPCVRLRRKKLTCKIKLQLCMCVILQA